jgi:PAS domain S-box-containing protein
LTVAALYENGTADEQNRWRELLTAHREQLREWAETYPPTFGDKHALVSAEIARLEGRDADAMRLYEQAIRAARENGFAQNEGLAHELAARFYAARGFETIAHAYLRNARYCYLRWGAEGKVRQLELSHPHLREYNTPATAAIGAHVSQFDFETVVKASQAVSGEIELGKLIETLMRIAIEHAGAERGLLILVRGDRLQIEAEARFERKTVEVALRQEPVTPAALPESLLHTVIRTQRSVILDDALAQNAFSADEYIRQKHARSALCVPLVKQAKLIGLLYLENNLTSHVFTHRRISVLELLATQAAISLENARLYNDLQEREARIRRLVDANIVGIVIWDFHGRIIEANEAFLDMVGYAREDLVSGRLRWTELTPAERREAGDRAVAEAPATVQPHETEYLRKDGSRVPVLVGAATFGDRQDQGVAFVLDLTDRKEAEDALRESEQRFRDYAETASDWLWETGPDHRFVRVSEELASVGISPALLIGAARWDFATDLEEEPEKWRRHFATLEVHEPFHGFRYRTTRGDGSVLHLAISGKPVFDRDGLFLGYRGVTSDVTAAVRAEHAEERLRKAQMELAHANRVATMGQLTASIAHEVNQPITATVTNAQAALRWLDASASNLDEVRQALADIVKDGNRAGDVVGRIRALVKKAPPRKDRLEINAAIREVLEITRREAMKNGVSVQTELADGLPLILGDRVELQQVILNLVINALEAMSDVNEGSRELLITTGQAESSGVVVVVKDSGAGLDQKSRDCLFKIFYTTKPDGMGMGLAICRSIVEAHGGRLWASENEPRGAIFQFTLPAGVEAAS